MDLVNYVTGFDEDVFLSNIINQVKCPVEHM